MPADRDMEDKERRERERTKKEMEQLATAYKGQMSMSHGGSRTGGNRSKYPQVGPDRTVTRSAPRYQLKAGDLSNFGKIIKEQPMTFGPSSVFAGKKTEMKKESISRTSSSSNMFSMLSSQPAENGDAGLKSAEPQRKRLFLQPRSKPIEATESADAASPTAESDSSVEETASLAAAPEMSEDAAMKKISEDVKEFFNVRNTQEDGYFIELPQKFRSRLVEKLVGHVVEAKEPDARLLSAFFEYATSKAICSPESFEEGFLAIAELIDDIMYDAPKALDLFAIVIKGNGLNRSRLSNIASKSSENSDKLLGLLSFGYSSEMVVRKVNSLLDKLTMKNFDSISDQIIEWVNEKDGRTLILVIKLLFEKAMDEAASEMYARLCRKVMEQISPKVQDDGIRNADGRPTAGGQLFRKYLLNRCQEDFERGWDQLAKKAVQGDQKEDYTLYSAQKAKRWGLGLIKFIGELFKQQMLTERIMHECVKKLLGNVDNPEEEEIESLCKLLTTVGHSLDTQKARAHMDVYFSRMKELTKGPHVTPRMQFMLQDIIELRERKWVARQAQAAPTTIAQVHEAAAKEKEKEAYQRQMSMPRGGSRRGGDRSEYPQVGPDGWTITGSAPRPQPKAGDLSNFGKISKGQPMTFGPSSVFAGKKTETKKESISRTSSSSNMFSMPSSQAAENGDAAPKPAEPQRKRLFLQPRSKPIEAAESADVASPTAESDTSVEETASLAAAPEMSEDAAMKKISEDVKEFFNVRNTQEDGYFIELPQKFRSRLVEKLVGHVVEAKEPDARLLSAFFEYATSKAICSPESFEEGFLAIAELIDDIMYDAPKALDLFAIVIKGSGLNRSRLSNIASKSSENSDKLLGLLSFGYSSEMVVRKVNSLLDKLTMKNFDSISDQIIEWVNEKDGRTLILVIKLLFEKAMDEAASEMYAWLCRKMMEQISPKVQDDGIRNADGKPIAGGQLFRKYLLNCCQEDFERRWVQEAVQGDQKEDYVLYSAQKARRRGLGLIKFIGELFKLQMLTERIMHECVKKLLASMDNPGEEEIESLCKLLTTVGHILDTQKAWAHMDVYFSRMKELTKSPHVTAHMQFMLQDVIELRERKWVTRQAQAAPQNLTTP